MTIKTGLELFNSIWLIEPQSAISYLQMWEQYMQHPEGRLFRSEQKEEDIKSFDKSIFLAADNIRYAPTDLWSREAKSFNGFDGAEIVIIPVEGPMMRNDFCGYAGTDTLSKFFQMADKTASVTTIIMLYNTPGGTVNGTSNFADVIAGKTKTVKSVVTNMCCSAGYWLASQGDEIIATSATDIIGSIGTMCSWYDRTKQLEANGIVLREFFATKSEDKNKAFSEANKGNGKLLVQSMLDPLNDEFIAAVLHGRSGKINADSDEVLTGKTFTAKKAKANGLIDDIMSFDKILEQSHAPKQKQKSPFTMKNFKLVIAAAAVASLYAEGKFFGLTEEQMEAVETEMQSQQDAIATANETIKGLQQSLKDLGVTSKSSADALIAANATIKTLQDEIVTLKAEDGTDPKIVSKETDDQPEVIPETSVEKWAKAAFAK